MSTVGKKSRPWTDVPRIIDILRRKPHARESFPIASAVADGITWNA